MLDILIQILTTIDENMWTRPTKPRPDAVWMFTGVNSGYWR